jgi:hypothetical protein
MKLHIPLLCTLLCTTAIFSQKGKQNNSSSSLEAVFQDIQQEKFFLHTNKTTYFSGEKIWWKAYVVSDFNNKATTNTTNLYVNFYDSTKKLISHQLFHCIDGKASGALSLAKTLKTGRYYIHVDTKWNKNFEAAYIVPVDIVHTKTDKVKSNTEIVQVDKEEVKMDFYPESGALLAGVLNTVFFTTKKGKRFIAGAKGCIINNRTRDTVSKFKSNRHGNGFFRLRYQANESYTAILESAGATQEFILEQQKDVGVVIQKKGILEDNSHQFSLKISKAIAKRYHKRTLFATVHRNGKLLYVLPVQIDKRHRSYGLTILEENLFKGINTLTVFNDTNTIIAERSFFNSKIEQIDVEVVQNRQSKDSISLDFKLKEGIASNLSISVLPQQSKMNKNATHILSAFLAAPYLSFPVDANLFFKNTISEREKDILLQVQKIKTPRKVILTAESKPVYKKETGLSIRGKINTTSKNLKDHKVLLSSTENEIIVLTDIKTDQSFEFNHLNLKAQSNYKLALLNEKGEFVDAGFYLYKKENYKVDSLLVYSEQATKIIEKQVAANLNTNAYVIPIDKSSQLLNEIVIKGKSKGEKIVEELYPNMPNELGNGFSKKIEINEQDVLNNTVLEFLNNQPGVSTVESYTAASVVIHRSAFSSLTGSNEALIIFNGTPTDAKTLLGMSLEEVKSIKINALGAGYGLRGGKGVVIIELKKGMDAYVRKPNKYYFSSKIDLGFSSSDTTYEAFNSVFSSKLSRSHFETLDWVPNLDLQPDTTSILQVYRGTHKKLTLFINGMNNQGQLIYKEVNLNLK